MKTKKDTFYFQTVYVLNEISMPGNQWLITINRTADNYQPYC